MVALVGRNGAGKTTVLRTIMGLTNLVAGEIAFEGREIAKMWRTTSGPGHRLCTGGSPAVLCIHRRGKHQASGGVARLPQADIARRLDEIYDMVPELKSWLGAPPDRSPADRARSSRSAAL